MKIIKQIFHLHNIFLMNFIIKFLLDFYLIFLFSYILHLFHKNNLKLNVNIIIIQVELHNLLYLL